MISICPQDFTLRRVSATMAVPSWEAVNLDSHHGTPDWFQQGEVHAHVRFVRSADGVPRQSEQPSVISQVDFETDRLVYLASVGPNAGCYLEIDGVTRTGDEIAVDGHIEREAGMAAQVITYPASLLWIQNTSIDHVTATITDGWQQTHTADTSL